MYVIKGNMGGEDYTVVNHNTAEYIGLEAEITENINRIPELNFKLPPDNNAIIEKLKTEIFVEDTAGNVEVFRGRCMENNSDFYDIKSYYCEGTMGYLVDTKYSPYIHTGDVSVFIQKLLDSHNKKALDKQKIYMGNITVTDSNAYMRRESKSYDSTLSIIQDKIVKSYSGLLRTRRTNNKNYLDYLAEYPESDQVIRFGENLLDLNKYAKAEEVRTVIIPLGAKNEETEERLRITSVNNGKEYLIDQNLVNEYGWIEEAVEFDDITLPANLKKRGEKYLEDCKNMSLTIELSAIDGRTLGLDVRRIYPGMKVKVVSKPHNLDTYFLCTSKTTSLFAPDKDKIILGNELESYTETVNRKNKEVKEKIEIVDKTLAQQIQDTRDKFNEELKNASGLYETREKQTDGSEIIYYHNKQKKADSDILFVFNDAGFAISADGGINWYGLKVNGDLIAKILTADGINANWIRTGELRADLIKTGVLYDKTGKSFWNMNTGELQISGALRQFTNAGVKSVEVYNNKINFYAWHDDGNWAGSIGSTQSENNLPSLAIYCDTKDSISFGTKDEGSDLVNPVMRITDNKIVDGVKTKILAYSNLNMGGFSIYGADNIFTYNGNFIKSTSSNPAKFQKVENLYMSGKNLIVCASNGETHYINCESF